MECVFQVGGLRKVCQYKPIRGGSRVILPCEMMKCESFEMAGNASEVVNKCMNYSYFNYVKLFLTAVPQ